MKEEEIHPQQKITDEMYSLFTQCIENMKSVEKGEEEVIKERDIEPKSPD